ncbi:ogr/Delta-like zinc finger family protein [Thalassotalea sp. 1_MG-2023]|uniref:ogr/Delta-like zinc finger family protein n=1 Tax=Thalassotalea sp. 1_MG-2023 TaxID=3062680 RepID=UPI0026E3E0CF|nr:ogr/Delta-like zinc finger family protein [Thalassotalea sp. 1_MG-2023]MDO6426217.1 ogr/Delta-like zinc finger family protein [Thalassotalea sp. 1_MG-2023]
MARVNCPNCQSKAVVTSKETLSSHASHLYCSCTNTKECGATFRVTLGFDHYLNPPMASTAQMAAAYLKQLPREQQLDLLNIG